MSCPDALMANVSVPFNDVLVYRLNGSWLVVNVVFAYPLLSMYTLDVISYCELLWPNNGIFTHAMPLLRYTPELLHIVLGY